ncbi:MAG: rRNA (uracil747-C5)-methyltransferase, partial [Campylobacterota bacterium]|nr:rRNA (uracil747-C5)-methyltransferase [Campylobacterota bacterium]
AKMVASGGEEGVILGLSDEVSLIGCPLYNISMQTALEHTQNWLRGLGIKAYDVKKKKGELKYVLLTRSAQNGTMMLRFVLRSHGIISRLEGNLESLIALVPDIKVVSVNIQPVHMAILEGEEEIFLTEQTRLEEKLNEIPLFIRPKSFFQTNPEVAAKLYKTVAKWMDELAAKTVIDLFCGVGGFALHVANNERNVIGIEIENEAIECAKESAGLLGIETLTFKALDAVSFSTETSKTPDVVIVNPPRRGLGQELCKWLERVSPHDIFYSSCNAVSLARDLEWLKSYGCVRVQLFDMFPHTQHYETLVHLKKQQGKLFKFDRLDG